MMKHRFDIFSAQDWPLFAGLASGLVLLSAFGFEYIGGYLPCPMCYAHRWIHVFSLVLGLGYYGLSQIKTDLKRHGPAACFLLALIFLAGFLYATRHAGIEYKWWAGPASCTGANVGTLSLEDLSASLDRVQHIPLCDEAAWVMFGISMAGYNALLSLGLSAMSAYIGWRNRTVK